MKRSAILLPILLVAWGTFAQVFDYSGTCIIKKLQFTDGISLKDDEGMPYGIIGIEHWSDASVKRPFAYVSGNAVKLTLSFISKCAAPYYLKGDGPDNFDFPPVQINATTPPGTTTTANFVCSSSFPPHVVRHFPKFKIDWYYSQDQVNWVKVATTVSPLYVLWDTPLPTVMSTVGPSDNSFFHTLVDIGCRNADGLSVKTQIVKTIYQDFQDQKVYGISHPNTPFTYYSWTGVPQPLNGQFPPFTYSCLDVQGLLDPTPDPVTGTSSPIPFSGRCGSFAEMLHDILEIQGIDNQILGATWKEYSLIYNGTATSGPFQLIDILPVLSQSETVQAIQAATPLTSFGSAYFHSVHNNSGGNPFWVVNNAGNIVGYQVLTAPLFFVNKWAFGTGSTPTNTFHLMRPTNESVTINGTTYFGKDTDGAFGQGADPFIPGTTNPWSTFMDHGMVYYEDATDRMILDPSYGAPIVSAPIGTSNANLLKLWENQALAGFGTVVWIKQFPTITDDFVYPFVWYGTQNNASLQCDPNFTLSN